MTARPAPRIAITGSTGVLGKAIRARYPNEEWVPFSGDIRRLEDIERWYADHEPFDSVLHFAARVPTRKVEAEPHEAFEVNVAGTCHLLEVVRQRPSRPWIFVASSSHVYAPSDIPLKEDDPLAPATLYGLTKMQSERWAVAYADKYGLPVCVGRIFSFTAPDQEKSFFIPAMREKIGQAAKGATLEIPGILGRRDFLTTDQISDAIMRLREKRFRGVVNIGSGRGVRLLDVAEDIRRELGREDVRLLPLDQGTMHLTADVTLLKSLMEREEP